jgi:Xaa-Pro aminopeptidase
MQIAPPEFHLARHARVREGLRDASLDALIVTSLPNVAYLTGLFASAAAVVVALDRLALIVDGRYVMTARARQQELDSIDVVTLPTSGSYEEAIAAVVGTFANGRVGIEEAHMTVRQHRDLTARVAAIDSGIEMSVTTGMVEQCRVVKDDWELQTLRDAGGRLSEAAKCILPKALAGQPERQVAAAIDAELRRVGFDKPAFDTIVAAGPNSAVPHHRAGNRALATGDLVILDFGGMLNGYAVDMTRTVAVGGARPRERRLLEQVAEAQSAAFAAIAIGRAATDVDRAAREVLAREGLGDAFSHGTGHGLGLEVHERPRLAKYRPELPAEPLAAGMVFTLEPGAYLEGWGGARIEDDVVVTAGGPEWLTDVPRMIESEGVSPR